MSHSVSVISENGKSILSIPGPVLVLVSAVSKTLRIFGSETNYWRFSGLGSGPPC